MQKIRPGLALVLLGGLAQRTQAAASGITFRNFLAKPVKQSILYDLLVETFRGERFKPRLQTLPTTGRGASVPKDSLRILLVEDNAINQKLALAFLDWFGYRADVAGNGLEAIQALERQIYDLVLMDMHMPEMDGLEATRRICARWPRGERPRIVGLSAAAMVEDRQAGAEAGMDAYLTKPIDMEELRAVLHECQPLDIPTAPASVPHAKESALDFAALRSLEGVLEKEQIVETIQLFLAESPELLAAIQRAIENQAAGAIKSPAHTLKGTSLSLGAAGLSAHCAELETLAKAGDFAGAARNLALAKEAYAEVERLLTAEATRLGEPDFVPVGRA